MRFVQLLWLTTRPGRAWVGSVSNKHNPSAKSGSGACISSRITTVIHVVRDHQMNYNCFNEPFAVLPYRSLYWDMHGLIFETSIWLLAGSTRLVSEQCQADDTVTFEISRAGNSQAELALEGELAPPNSGSGRWIDPPPHHSLDSWFIHKRKLGDSDMDPLHAEHEALIQGNIRRPVLFDASPPVLGWSNSSKALRHNIPQGFDPHDMPAGYDRQLPCKKILTSTGSHSSCCKQPFSQSLAPYQPRLLIRAGWAWGQAICESNSFKVG